MKDTRKFNTKEKYRQVFISRMIRSGKTIVDINNAWNKMRKESLAYIQYVVFNTNMFRR